MTILVCINKYMVVFFDQNKSIHIYENDGVYHGEIHINEMIHLNLSAFTYKQGSPMDRPLGGV